MSVGPRQPLPFTPRRPGLPNPGPTTLTRRGLLGAGALVGVGALAGCATGPVSAPAPSTTDLSATDKTLAVSNWSLYIDTDDKGPELYPTIAAFEGETGIEVEYTEDIADNESFYAKVAPLLRNGQPIGRDIMVLTDWMAARMIREGLVQSIDKTAMPNTANLVESLQSPTFDPQRTYSMPWQAGFSAIAYNSEVVDTPVRSITEMLTRPDLAGRVAVFSEMRDTIGLVMLDQGADPSAFTPEQFDAALAVIQQAVDSDHLRQFADANYGQALAKGDLAASMTYSGDINQLQYDSPSLVLSIPDSGFILWSDNMLVPLTSEHRANAQQWMDFYYRPDIAAQVAAWVNFITPVDGAKEEAEAIDPELASNPLIFPSEDDLAKGRIFKALDATEEQEYTQAFQTVAGL